MKKEAFRTDLQEGRESTWGTKSLESILDVGDSMAEGTKQEE